MWKLNVMRVAVRVQSRQQAIQRVAENRYSNSVSTITIPSCDLGNVYTFATCRICRINANCYLN